MTFGSSAHSSTRIGFIALFATLNEEVFVEPMEQSNVDGAGPGGVGVGGVGEGGDGPGVAHLGSSCAQSRQEHGADGGRWHVPTNGYLEPVNLKLQ